jgi:hypothetical protein
LYQGSRMKNILVTVLLGLSSIAYAQPFRLEKPLVCDETARFMEVLRGSEFKEIPFWFGADSDSGSKFMMVVNEKTKTWTMIQFTGKVACILGSGDSYKFIKGPAI